MLLRPNTIYKWDLHYEQAVWKTVSFFQFRNNLGEMGFYRETIDFWVFAIGYWSSHWNGIRKESLEIFPLHLLDTGFLSVEDIIIRLVFILLLKWMGSLDLPDRRDRVRWWIERSQIKALILFFDQRSHGSSSVPSHLMLTEPLIRVGCSG